MKLLGRPTLPPGAQAFVYMSVNGRQWSVRVAMPGEEQSAKCKRVSPVFALQTSAYAWLDWATGVAKNFDYPEGAA